MCVRIWLEVGHACEPRRSVSGRALALDWRVWVRGARGDISAFVHKVVFKLHPPSAFFYPRRGVSQSYGCAVIPYVQVYRLPVLWTGTRHCHYGGGSLPERVAAQHSTASGHFEPPYEIKESGCASIDIPIHVYLKYADKPKKIRLRYSLQIESNDKTHSESKCVYYDFENPAEPLCSALMKGGGEVIARAGKINTNNNKLVVLFSDDERSKMRSTKTKRYEFIEPIRCKHGPKKRTYVLEDICSKCGDSIDAEFRKQLRSVEMTEHEINRVSQLYLSFTNYEKSINALTLPPFSDPIYSIPELPISLRGALTSVEADYSMQ